MINKLSIIILFIPFLLIAQEPDIVPYLKQIEAGRIDDVKKSLLVLKKSYTNHPDLIFLEAVLTEDGEESIKYYELVYNDFPKSNFADAALFRSFSYYYALGLYKKAGELKSRLEKEYPNSPYLKNTEREFPEVDEMIIVDTEPYKMRGSGKSEFTVQAGAFSNFNNAEALKNRFIRDGLFSKISPKKVNNIQLHIVTVGKFVNRTEAEKFILELESNYSLKGRVLEIN
jgi:hypothetical protein